MATKSATASPLSAFGEMTRFAELRQRLFFLLGALIVYRIGTFIPVPGIDPVALSRFFQSQQGTILSMVNMFSGGAISRLSIFALGVMPYISASIIIQMMAVVVPSLTSIKKEGESGRRKLTQYTRYGTVLLAAVQGSSAAIALQNQNVVIAPGPQFVFDVSNGASGPADPDTRFLLAAELRNSNAHPASKTEAPKVWVSYSWHGRPTEEIDEELALASRRIETAKHAERERAIQSGERSTEMGSDPAPQAHPRRGDRRRA